MNAIKRVAARLIRATVATSVAGLVAKASTDPRFVFLSPLLLALGKALRERYPKASPFIPI